MEYKYVLRRSFAIHGTKQLLFYALLLPNNQQARLYMPMTLFFFFKLIHSLKHGPEGIPRGVCRIFRMNRPFGRLGKVPLKAVDE